MHFPIKGGARALVGFRRISSAEVNKAVPMFEGAFLGVGLQGSTKGSPMCLRYPFVRPRIKTPYSEPPGQTNKATTWGCLCLVACRGLDFGPSQPFKAPDIFWKPCVCRLSWQASTNRVESPSAFFGSRPRAGVRAGACWRASVWMCGCVDVWMCGCVDV